MRAHHSTAARVSGKPWLLSFVQARKQHRPIGTAYWALFTDDREETTFNQAVNLRCALPRLETQQERAGRILIQELGRRFGPGLPIIPARQPLTEQHVRCVIAAFHNRAAALRSRLTGDALIESNLSPEEHKDIQVVLFRKGFLQNRIGSYGANPDGQFGPNTRAAIKDFQRSIGAQPTGFLSNEQRVALIESPEEREARDAREKERQDEIERQKRAEEQAKRAAIEQERKRLEMEAEKAREWRRKIDEAQKKGSEYAKATDLNWSFVVSDNPMTDDQDYSVSSNQTNGTGALAVVEGQCVKDEVQFDVTLHNKNEPKVPLGYQRSSLGGVIGKKRINDNTALATSFPIGRWSNEFRLSNLSFRNDDPESADITWRILAEIETTRGTLYVKLPTFDPTIQKLIINCKKHYEIEKLRQGSFDG